MINSRLRNKTILITGAGTGMGRATAIRLAQEGAQLVLMGRRAIPLQELVSEIESFDGKAMALPCDIAQQESLSVAIEKVIDTFGQLDGLFANAGVLGEFTALADTELNQLDDVISINLRGTFSTIKSCLPFLESGSIVINASWTANAVMPGAGAYAATKGALLSMMKTLAIEQGQRGIRVNAISPGIILTPMAEKVLDAELSLKLSNQAALKRNGTPNDISGTVAWLLSDDATFVTGQEVLIDGGYTLGGIRL
ncbi:SDR family NAD(P)-dependent oxidoreductase [Vibrio sp. WJH972]